MEEGPTILTGKRKRRASQRMLEWYETETLIEVAHKPKRQCVLLDSSSSDDDCAAAAATLVEADAGPREAHLAPVTYEALSALFDYLEDDFCTVWLVVTVFATLRPQQFSKCFARREYADDDPWCRFVDRYVVSLTQTVCGISEPRDEYERFCVTEYIMTRAFARMHSRSPWVAQQRARGKGAVTIRYTCAHCDHKCLHAMLPREKLAVLERSVTFAGADLRRLALHTPDYTAVRNYVAKLYSTAVAAKRRCAAERAWDYHLVPIRQSGREAEMLETMQLTAVPLCSDCVETYNNGARVHRPTVEQVCEKREWCYKGSVRACEQPVSFDGDTCCAFCCRVADCVPVRITMHMALIDMINERFVGELLWAEYNCALRCRHAREHLLPIFGSFFGIKP